MTKIIIINKLGKVTMKNVKSLSIDHLYKYCNLKKSNKNFKIRHTWKNNSNFVSVFAKDNGRAGSENKFELPRPLDEILYFGNILLLAHSENVINNNNCIDLTLEEWAKLYDRLIGGSESLGEEDSFSDDDEIPDELKTNGGYMKDGFVVDDDDEIEYESSDNLDDKVYDEDEVEEEEEDEEEEEEDDDEDDEDEYMSDEYSSEYESSVGSELETEESSEEENEEEDD